MQLFTTAIAAIAPMAKLAAAQSAAGTATYYTQQGVAGSCGEYHQDPEWLVALGPIWAHNAYCGHGIWVQNPNNQAYIWARVVDTCPGCGGYNIDLSVGAYKALNNGQISLNPFFVNYYIA